MSEELTFTVDGLDALHALPAVLPPQVEVSTRLVAQATAARVLARAQANWSTMRKSHEEPHLAAAMTIREDASQKQFVVESHAPEGRPEMVPNWIEYGTIKMPARPYMQLAATAETAQYVSDMEAAALEPVRAALER